VSHPAHLEEREVQIADEHTRRVPEGNIGLCPEGTTGLSLGSYSPFGTKISSDRTYLFIKLILNIFYGQLLVPALL
jgi:hypothetical protein